MDLETKTKLRLPKLIRKLKSFDCGLEHKNSNSINYRVTKQVQCLRYINNLYKVKVAVIS